MMAYSSPLNKSNLCLLVALLLSSLLPFVHGQELTPEQQANANRTLHIGYVRQPISCSTNISVY
jgi:hypothetical protein